VIVRLQNSSIRSKRSQLHPSPPLEDTLNRARGSMRGRVLDLGLASAVEAATTRAAMGDPFRLCPSNCSAESGALRA